MQHFLPYPEFEKTAKVLDRQRLGKQRMESRDTLIILLGKPDWCSPEYYSYLTKRYKNHPAVLQWQSNEVALYDYLRCICQEWIKRGYKDNCLEQAKTLCAKILEGNNAEAPTYINPWWLFDPGYHATHRAALLYKNIVYYKKLGWKERPIISYCWPVTKQNIDYSLKRQEELRNPKSKKDYITCGSDNDKTIFSLDSFPTVTLPQAQRGDYRSALDTPYQRIVTQYASTRGFNWIITPDPDLHVDWYTFDSPESA